MGGDGAYGSSPRRAVSLALAQRDDDARWQGDGVRVSGIRVPGTGQRSRRLGKAVEGLSNA